MVVYKQLKEKIMKQFEGHVDPELKKFLEYDDKDLSSCIGDDYRDITRYVSIAHPIKEEVVEMVKDGEDSYVTK